MSIRHRPDLEERGSILWRSVVVLLLVGVGLALVTNGILLASGSRRGLAWVRTEKKMQSLEDLSGSTVVDSIASAPEGAPASPPAPETSEPQPANPTGSTPMSTAKKPATTTTKPAASTTSAKPAQNPPAAGTTAAPNAEKSVPAGAKTTPATDVPTVPDSRDPIEAKMPMVKKFYDAQAALFVDARETVEYTEGHIAGAVSLPFDEAFKDPKKLKAIDPKGRPVIIYCGGGDCEASKNLAYALIDAGLKKVVVFTDGYPAWTGAGYPTAKGAEPGAAK